MNHFTASDGTRLAYRDEGDGPVILALSGLSRNATDFDYLIPHLPPVRLIRMDYRGRGGSDHADPATYAVPVEARDALELLDHLSLEKTAILGTSRGGIIAMVLAAMAKDRLTGVALNDIGPEIAPAGLETIKDYIGRNPAAKTHEDAAQAMATRMAGFANVSDERWLEEARKHFAARDGGLVINYDPKLRDAVLASAKNLAPDLWPAFDAMDGLPLALIRGANSDLLSAETAAEMQRRRPDMIFAAVPDRGHIPFLDEPEAVDVLTRWIERLPV